MITWDNLGTIVAVGLGIWLGLGLVVAVVIGKSIKQADDIEQPTSEERWAKQAEESSVLG